MPKKLETKLVVYLDEKDLIGIQEEAKESYNNIKNNILAKKNWMESKMEYTVKWIINGEINISAESKEKAENIVKDQLKLLVDENNNKSFDELGAKAIQGSANLRS